MARKTPSTNSLRQLYAHSGNQCAFPGCDHPIFNKKGVFIAQVCHINAANEGGERYNTEQTDEERRAYDNLLLMCHRHHKETDIIEDFPEEKLRELKEIHEAQFSEEGREASEQMIRQFKFEIDYYWNRISNKEFNFEELKIERDFDKEIFALYDELEEHIKSISNYCDVCAESDSSKVLNNDLMEIFKKVDLDFEKTKEVPYYENPLIHRNWELHNIGRPNYFSHLYLCVDQLKLRTTESLLNNDPENKKLRDLLDRYQKEFDENYSNSYYVD